MYLLTGVTRVLLMMKKNHTMYLAEGLGVNQGFMGLDVNHSSVHREVEGLK